MFGLKSAWCPGHAHPSKVGTRWACHGRENEYPSITTKPQQDHQDINRIYIHDPTDIRATPWCQHFLANMHDGFPTALPPLDHDEELVQEFIYYILAMYWSKIPNSRPQDCMAVIIEWQGDAKDLRNIGSLPFGRICPSTWTDTYFEDHNISDSNRLKIEKHIKDVVAKLLKLEKADSAAKAQRQFSGATLAEVDGKLPSTVC
jgi:hypothetical protein